METNNLHRRDFIKNTATSAIGLTIIPSFVLGGPGHVAPNEKLNIALIGCGTQALKMLPEWLQRPELQFVSVCDPNRESHDYPQWGTPQGETRGAAGGREVAKRMINEYYTQTKKTGYKGCTAYADFRELLEKEKDLDAVFILTPDHLHATIAVAAMKKNIKVASHKPIGNFMQETRVVCDTAKRSGISTWLFAWQDPKENYIVKEWIKQGVIGEVKELHRWTNRPMWPQGSPYLPTNTPPIPDGFNWDLWLGPSLPRTYSPDYTHTVFRGWYEFGSGCLADMGYYGFWVDWRILNLGMPLVAEGCASFNCQVKDFRSLWVKNNLSYPHAGTVQWEVPVNATNKNLDVFWYEGGIRPRTPKALTKAGKGMPSEGVMFVGEKGSILVDYGYGNPRLIGMKDADKMAASIKIPEVKLLDQTTEMINAFKTNKSDRGSFINAQTIAEAICLGNLSIRMNERLEWDNNALQVKNIPEANEFVARKCRSGWQI